MNVKALFVVFLCLLSASVIFGMAIATQNKVEASSCETFTLAESTDCLLNNGVQPTGDPKEGGGWPQTDETKI